ncbi:hypothetical protein CW304_32150 [Bacillus sp. UFRGS-B20]|nr:hypothetical protein CW304_32150 [Bacillus sp. UFRGS-B20]
MTNISVAISLSGPTQPCAQPGIPAVGYAGMFGRKHVLTGARHQRWWCAIQPRHGAEKEQRALHQKSLDAATASCSNAWKPFPLYANHIACCLRAKRHLQRHQHGTVSGISLREQNEVGGVKFDSGRVGRLAWRCLNQKAKRADNPETQYFSAGG